MPSFNKVILTGNLTRDPQTRYTPSGSAVADICLAVNREYKSGSGEKVKETTFVDITLWKRQAEIAEKYLKKGSSVLIEGRLHMDQWEDKKTGQKRSKLKVIGENMQMLDSRGAGNNATQQASQGEPAKTQGNLPMEVPAAGGDSFYDEDVPF